MFNSQVYIGSVQVFVYRTLHTLPFPPTSMQFRLISESRMSVSHPPSYLSNFLFPKLFIYPLHIHHRIIITHNSKGPVHTVYSGNRTRLYHCRRRAVREQDRTLHQINHQFSLLFIGELGLSSGFGVSLEGGDNTCKYSLAVSAVYVIGTLALATATNQNK